MKSILKRSVTVAALIPADNRTECATSRDTVTACTAGESGSARNWAGFRRGNDVATGV